MKYIMPTFSILMMLLAVTQIQAAGPFSAPPSDKPPLLGPPAPDYLPPPSPKEKANIDILAAGAVYYHAADFLVSRLNPAQQNELCAAGSKGIRASSGVACNQTLGAALGLAVCYHKNIASFKGSNCDKNALTLLGERTQRDRPTQLNIIGGHIKKDGVEKVCAFVAGYISSFDKPSCVTFLKEKLAGK